MVGDDADRTRIAGDRRRAPYVVGALPDEREEPFPGFVDGLRVADRAQIVSHAPSLECGGDKIATYRAERRQARSESKAQLAQQDNGCHCR